MTVYVVLYTADSDGFTEIWGTYQDERDADLMAYLLNRDFAGQATVYEEEVI
jgi:hypothetical protein